MLACALHSGLCSLLASLVGRNDFFCDWLFIKILERRENIAVFPTMVLTRAQAAAAQDDVEIDGDIDDGKIHDTADDGEIGAAGDDAKKEVDRCINALKSKESQSSDDAVRQEGASAEQPEDSQ
uniref:Uncharacterized protein n=1 Tax=Phytophthora ramorum TaxID=164328 RepID=H3GDT0_PHYRM